MKYLQIIIIFYFGLTFAQEHHTKEMQDKPSTHGMLLFGKENIYASHLPMFHSPHDYQIVLELELDSITKTLFTTDQEKNPEFATYTIEPETFVLPEMISNPRIFKANLYRGHFERGGIKIASEITIRIKKVIYNSKFNSKEKRATNTNFILFGNQKEQFIIHQITNKPDFDQIIQVKTTLNNSLDNKKFELITLNKSSNEPIGVSGNEVETASNTYKPNIFLLKQLYLEFEDLK